MKIKLTNISGYHSKVINEDGNSIKVDNKSIENPKGVSPMELLLMGVAGCSSIDTHLHRMMNQLKWVNTKTPEQTRSAIEAWLPLEYWSQINLIWVGMGQGSFHSVRGVVMGL